jgi:hypothetical protein
MEGRVIRSTKCSLGRSETGQGDYSRVLLPKANRVHMEGEIWILSTRTCVRRQAAREATQSLEPQASWAETQRRNAIAQHEWKNSNGPALSERICDREIQPRLASIYVAAIATALSWSHAADIRRGRRRRKNRFLDQSKTTCWAGWLVCGPLQTEKTSGSQNTSSYSQ